MGEERIPEEKAGPVKVVPEGGGDGAGPKKQQDPPSGATAGVSNKDGTSAPSNRSGNTSTSGSSGSSGGAGGSTSSTLAGPLDATLRIEVDLLTHGTLLRVANDIAIRCCDATGQSDTVLVATPPLLVALSRARLLALELETLSESIRAIPGPTSTNKEFAAALGVAGLIAGIEKAGTLVAAIKSAVTALEVEDKFDARDVKLEPLALATIVASRMRRHRRTVVLESAAALAEPSADGALHRVFAAAEDLRVRHTGSKTSSGVDAVLERLSALLKDARTADPPPLSLLAVCEANPDAHVLTVQLLAGGGAYRTRSHFLTVLGLADKLTVSAGASILWSLIDSAGSAVVEGDLSFHWSGQRRLAGSSPLIDLSNLRYRGS